MHGGRRVIAFGKAATRARVRGDGAKVVTLGLNDVTILSSGAWESRVVMAQRLSMQW